MEIRRQDDKYLVESSKPGRFYEVDPKNGTCTCPHFMFRMKKSGGVCKHIEQIRQHLQENCGSVRQEALAYIEQAGSADAVELIEKYGEDIIEELKAQGEIIESRGVIRIFG